MTGTLVLTGTLGSEILQVATIAPGEFLLGASFALAVLFVMWLWTARFQMWALTVVLILSVLYLPFALTPMAGYAVITSAFTMVVISALHFFVKVEWIK